MKCHDVIDLSLDTPILDVVRDDQQKMDHLVGLHPLGRIGRPEEVAHAVVFLASEESSFTTGSEFVMDGGYTAQ